MKDSCNQLIFVITFANLNSFVASYSMYTQVCRLTNIIEKPFSVMLHVIEKIIYCTLPIAWTVRIMQVVERSMS